MKIYKLYVDELGMSHPKSYEKSPYFIMLGCIIEEQSQRELENLANHVKYKYWSRTDIIFHSADIARNIGDFEIFSGEEKLKKSFEKDLFSLLRSAPVFITAALIDKEKAYESFWQEIAVISKAAEIVLFNFLAFVYTKLPARGKIIIEASSGYRDREYLSAFNYLLSPVFENRNNDFVRVRDNLTSINFVTKQNHDIESQLADLFAYGVRCLHEEAEGKATYKKGSYEEKLVTIVKGKLIQASANVGQDKKKFYDKIDTISVVPKKISKPKEKRA